ncbi:MULTISPECIES: hypothetical protein [unclassified Bradyrhizobium]|uniref:hypothetical protein n=1 Tax=unclassified Bradyrhizobium TaxID=2631580 RepID=UPI001CD73D16|nr:MULTISPECIES: hypothetical protein [unclassified Bradyrhizobium]MCA1427328.1 hypothetical protein [Bradyrhizobium sp. NBAIM16]MCA1506848.1 hypothetical protein [Bradyrhizobium sp. NBAIM02]
MRVTLVGAGKTVSFETMEAAGGWLLEQAGVRDLAIVRRSVGAWALCEALQDGTKKVLVEVSTKSEAQLGSLLFRKFYQEWFAVLGFEALNPPAHSSPQRLASGRHRQPSYLFDERAHIAAFGY